MPEGLATTPFLRDVLKTKLHIPELRPNLVSRSRLVERFTQGLMRPLTLISAPAGSGKTTLISEWHASLQGQQMPLAWLSLDPDDNDSARFWAYVIAALETLQPASLKTVVTTLVNNLTAMMEDFVLVLDDYHVIEAQAIHESLAFLLDHRPPHMRLVFASRTDPPFPLARLRVRDQVVEIRAADMRFTPEEAAAFLNHAMGLALSADDIAALESRTEGWIAGLQLAAMAIPGHADVSGFISAFSGSNRFVLDYLVEEVLRCHPEDLQTFLMQTSILERLCGPLCDAVTGRADSQTVLATLEQANLFTIPLDDERRWYRYHHLFAEFLRSRLHQSPFGAQVAELHCRASEWYAQAQLDTEAIRHALDAQDYERAAHLIEQNRDELLVRGEAMLLMGWLQALPESVIRDRRGSCWPWPGLCC